MSEPEEQASPEPPVLSYLTPSTPDERWTTIWTAPTALEGHIVVSKLQSMGLHARLDGENAAPLGGIEGPSNLLQSKVQVLQGDAEAAREVISEIERKQKERRDANIIRCPECDVPARRLAHPVRRAGVAGLLLMVLLFIVGAVLDNSSFALSLAILPVAMAMLVWSVTPRWVCPSCGRRWAQREPDEDEFDDDEEEAEDDEEEEANEEN